MVAEAPDMTAETEVEIINAHGLHARPAHQVVVTANRFPCSIFVSKEDLEVDAKSIMSLMMLAAEKGMRLRIRAEGPQAGDAVRALRELIGSGFGEE